MGDQRGVGRVVALLGKAAFMMRLHLGMILDSILRDIRFGLRGLRKHWGFSVTAVGTLALGISSGTAIFSVVSSVLFGALPYPDPDRVVMLWERGPKLGSDRHGANRRSYLAWKEEGAVFSDIGYFWHMNYITLEFKEDSDDHRSKPISGRYVSPSLFSVLGVEPILGRTLGVAEDIDKPSQVVVISHRLWQQRFQGHADVLGETLTLENYGSMRTYSVIGVMPPGFSFPGETDLWLPAGWFRPPPRAQRESAPKGHDLFVVARLKPGISLEDARVESNALQEKLAKQYPNAWVGSRVDVTTLGEELFGSTRLAFMVLLASVGAVLLLACANLANLLLFRATARMREIGMRAALGATRWLILRLLITEALLLTVIGGMLGAAFAYWGVEVLARYVPVADSAESDAAIIMAGPAAAIHIDGVSLGFACLLMGTVALIFGLAPAVIGSKSDLTLSLKEGAKSTTQGRGALRLHGLFLTGQITVALALLSGAALAIESFSRLNQVDPGFEPEGMLVGHVDFAGLTYRERQVRVDHSQELIELLEALPGVVSVAGIHELPLNKFGRWRRVVKREAQTLDPGSYWPNTEVDPVTPNFFHTMRVPLLRGREFTRQDVDEADHVAILNQTMAHLLWPNGEDPIGQTIRLGLSEKYYWLDYRVVGVVGDTRSLRLDREAPAITYLPFAQMWPQGMSRLNVVIRTENDPASLIGAVKNTGDQVNARFPIHDVRVLENEIAEAAAPARFLMLLLGLLGLAAMVLAAMGVYGVVAYYVERRRSEIGLRMALGARPGEVVKLVVSHGLRFTLMGIVPGLLGAWVLSQMMQSLLYDGLATGPALLVVTVALLIFVAAVACCIPAWRAARIDPLIALRAE